MVDRPRRNGAVSPLIATVLLLALTVAVASLAAVTVLNSNALSSPDSSTIDVKSYDDDGNLTVLVVSGTADELQILVNGTITATIRNPSPGDNVTVSATPQSRVSVVSVSESTRRVVSSANPVARNYTSSIPDTISWNSVWYDSYEDDTVGASPNEWNVTNDGSNGDVKVSTNWRTDGSHSMRTYQPDTGSPSHWHATRTTTINKSQVRVSFDVNVTGKQNTGSANTFSFSLRNGPANNGGNRSFLMDFVKGGSISIYNGSSWVALESVSYNTRYYTVITADYNNQSYTVSVNGREYGPYPFVDSLSPTNSDYLHHLNDNYNGYVDNVTVEHGSP